MKAKLQHIVSAILEEEIDYFALGEAIELYKELLKEISPIDAMEEVHKKDISLEKGVAIGLTWAALCLDDKIRTRQFIKGIAAAIEQVRTGKNTPVHLVYAGTGPYATLILPILSLYTPDELQLSLLEINENSYQNVQHIFKKLGFQDFISSIICADATTYVFPNPESIDIIVSETMQHALQKEMQVPITINLLQQVPVSTIFIPQQIDLRFAALRSLTSESTADNYHIIGMLLEWNADMARKITSQQFPKQTFLLDKSKFKDYHYLAILTDIQVFDEHSINIRQSGLTIPKILMDVESIPDANSNIHFQYQLLPSPEMTYDLVRRPTRIQSGNINIK